MAEPFSPYAGIEGAALTGGESGDLLHKLLLGVLQGTAEIPQRVIEATKATYPGLRREDFTDIPGSAQPGEEMRKGALETALMTMGATPFGVPAMRAGEMAVGAGPIRAYHGSPHDFDRFDLSKIGTGEGAQAYGRGLYFAEREGVARSYRDALAADPRDEINLIVQGWTGYRKPGELATEEMVRKGLANHHMAPLNEAAKNPDFIRNLTAYINGISDDLKTVSPEAMRALRETDKALPKPGGHIYEVNINADPAHFLDWDRPISGQHPRVEQGVYEALLRSGLDKSVANHLVNNAEGAQVVRQMSRPSWPIRDDVKSPWKAGGATREESLAMVGGDKSRINTLLTPDPEYTRQALLSERIPGVKYADQWSRAPAGIGRARLEATIGILKDDIARLEKTGGGNLPRLREKLASQEAALVAMPKETRNYVVFDDKLVDILRKYGIAGAGPVGALAAGSPEDR